MFSMPTLHDRALMACKSFRHDYANFKNGIHARFKAIDGNWGVKFYVWERQRDENYDLQKRGAELGICPKVADKFSFVKTIQGKQFKFYGFITEVVHPLTVTHEAIDRLTIYKTKINELRTFCKIHNFPCEDAHFDNVALQNNKLLLIDVSTNGEHYTYHSFIGYTE